MVRVMIELLAGGLLALFWAPTSAIAVMWTLVESAGLLEKITLLVGLASILFTLFHVKERKKLSAGLSIFLFGMLIFLQATDWLYLYFGWEFMSLCSYVLIRLDDREAARKAFLMNGVGSLALMLALVLIYEGTGTFSFTTIPSMAALFILIAAMVKSSQFPFIWLPEAMKAKTPVSALLHSATLVAAGPLLIFRLSDQLAPILPLAKTWAWLSLLISAILALSQEEPKRVLAYSTIGNMALLFTMQEHVHTAFAVHALLKAGYFILLGTCTMTGLRQKSLSGFMSLFFLASLAGVPLLGMFWFKSGLVGAVTVALSTLYLLRMHSQKFSGGIPPKNGVGTYISLGLGAASLPLILNNPLPSVNNLLLMGGASYLAYRLSHLNMLSTPGKLLSTISPSFKLQMSQDVVEESGYALGKKVMGISSKVRQVMTGPVSRDVSYIVISLVALAAGVLLC